ncbi:MAG: hypothetical protein ACP5E9_06780, partial [Candidatus Methanospirareceae archaeon]
GCCCQEIRSCGELYDTFFRKRTIMTGSFAALTLSRHPEEGIAESKTAEVIKAEEVITRNLFLLFMLA